MSDRNDNQRAAFDDDRLLDYALGIEDDPELAVALSSSARRRERLADLKSDLAAIETELHRTVPPIDESYADPGAAARWPRAAKKTLTLIEYSGFGHDDIADPYGRDDFFYFEIFKLIKSAVKAALEKLKKK